MSWLHVVCPDLIPILPLLLSLLSTPQAETMFPISPQSHSSLPKQSFTRNVSISETAWGRRKGSSQFTYALGYYILPNLFIWIACITSTSLWWIQWQTNQTKGVCMDGDRENDIPWQSGRSASRAVTRPDSIWINLPWLWGVHGHGQLFLHFSWDKLMVENNTLELFLFSMK